jgi:hypothetical protein
VIEPKSSYAPDEYNYSEIERQNEPYSEIEKERQKIRDANEGKMPQVPPLESTISEGFEYPDNHYDGQGFFGNEEGMQDRTDSSGNPMPSYQTLVQFYQQQSHDNEVRRRKELMTN